ncbi:MAG: SusD/RagB family nutrient-binding outer membrane lipoprotein [Chryseolinea sp.]
MKKLKYYLPLLLTIGLLVSCEKSLEELNIDPNNPAKVSVQLALPAGTVSVAGITGGRFAVIGGIWSQFYTQNNASNQYKDIDAFYYTPSDFAATWQEMYAGGLNDLQYVRREASKTGDWNFYLIATTMQVYAFQNFTDVFGDIPFSEALRGDQGISEPVYETSQAIYDSLITRLDVALSKDFTASTNTNAGPADFVFGGDMEKWIHFANTLKLKIYLRYAEVNPSKAQAGIAALNTSGVEFLSEDAALAVFEDAASKSNPFFEQDKRTLNTTQNLKASRTLFDLLDQSGDQRKFEIYNAAEAGGYKAMNQGDFNAPTTVLAPLTISTAKVDALDPVYLISEAESYFLQAEAVERGWGTGDAEALYEMGVTASFEQTGYGDDAADLLAGEYSFDTYFGGGLAAILMQKWIAFAGTQQGMEAFFDRMRTGYPEESPVYHSDPAYEPGLVVYPKEGTTQGQFARRLFLPDTETSRNPNAPSQANLWDPMWWHK